ncbi:hypothetical protein V8Q34_22510 [Blautia sp. JLR.GB0024]|mgnify:FL=1|jgi:hypothetical protein|uniref:hypothetical protein n=1 Tax=Blautia sp. JLR.GB0024 TaxID=3123295 RepID=UPI0030059C70
MDKYTKKALIEGILWLLLLLFMFICPEFMPVIGLVILGVFLIKVIGKFFDSHL